MTATGISRVFGAVIMALIGLALGALIAPHTEIGTNDAYLIAAVVGALIGLLGVAPLLQAANKLPAAQLLLALLGGLLGAALGLLLAYPLSLIGAPALPALVALLGGGLGMQLFCARASEIRELFQPSEDDESAPVPSVSGRQLLLDTSVLIDGRIVEIAETGFIDGALEVPHFVLGELHRVADSGDSLRRNRGRRGLATLNELQRDNHLTVDIIEDDVDKFGEVDSKLVALAIKRGASLITNDFNLNQVADAQGVSVLNINALANAVRSVYIPGETFNIRILQPGKDTNQGVGYLDDGTMVVVESGQLYMNRSIDVEVTKLINRPTGRMIFAAPIDILRR